MGVNLGQLCGLALWVSAGLALAADPVDSSKLPAAASTPIDFARDIKPIFDTSCLRCHGPEKPKSKFRLDNRDAALKGGETGVAIIPGTTTEASLTGALKKHAVTATMVPVKDHDAGVAALDQGTADAYASDRVILIGIGRTSKNPEKLSLVDEFFSYEPYGLMLRRGDAAFRLSVNRALASLYRSGDVAPIFEKWFGSLTTAGPLIGAMYLMNGLPE